MEVAARAGNPITSPAAYNVWDTGLILFIDEDQAALAKFNTDSFQTQSLNVALPSRCDQGAAVLLWTAVLKGYMHKSIFCFNARQVVIKDKLEPNRLKPVD